jgi:hypothetical protein
VTKEVRELPVATLLTLVVVLLELMGWVDIALYVIGG